MSISEDDLVSLLNAYFVYYKDSTGINITNFFDKVTDKNPTNMCMELFYDHMNRYKDETNEDNKLIATPGIYTIELCDEVYTLTTQSNTVLQCPYLIPLLYYIVTNNLIAWKITVAS